MLKTGRKPCMMEELDIQHEFHNIMILLHLRIKSLLDSLHYATMTIVQVLSLSI